MPDSRCVKLGRHYGCTCGPNVNLDEYVVVPVDISAHEWGEAVMQLPRKLVPIPRPSKQQAMLQVAQVMATRATCKKLQAGVVLATPDLHILATGYNGAPAGLPHCIDEGCVEEAGHCVRSVHAEANALMQAARHGVRLEGSSLFATHSCCVRCSLLAVQAGVREVVFLEPYGGPEMFRLMLDTLLGAGVVVYNYNVEAGLNPVGR